MITACDVRLCTADTVFCVKEVQVGLAADVGTLQRLPKVGARTAAVPCRMLLRVLSCCALLRAKGGSLARLRVACVLAARLPKVIGSQSLVRELCLTGRKMGGAEALSCGLVSGGRTYADKEACVTAGLAMARSLAALSPIAVQGTKAQLLYSRDHSVEDGLDYVATWNGAMLQSDDLKAAMIAGMTKTEAKFSKL